MKIVPVKTVQDALNYLEIKIKVRLDQKLLVSFGPGAFFVKNA